MIRLFINVDHVATVREARKTDEPDPLKAAFLAEMAGADGITIHLREDRRHIQDHDVVRICESIKTKMNLEIAPTDEMLNIALENKPYQVSLVPEKREEITTEGGLDIASIENRLRSMGEQFKKNKILFSLFIDPDHKQVEASKRVGADSVEFNTGQYTELTDEDKIIEELEKIRSSSKLATQLGLRVFAGHGLNNQNVIAIAAIPEIEELNIGHNIISKSIYLGMEKAVKEMFYAINRGIKLRPQY
jgi:pyridoxine 5-phosphate synthase